MKKITVVSCAAVMSLCLSSCASSLAKKAIDECKLSITSGDYESALSYLKLARDEGGNDKEIDELLLVIQGYVDAKNDLDKGNFDGAESVLNSISGHDKYGIADDIAKLKQNIKTKREAEIQDQIAAVKSLIASGDYTGAVTKINELYIKNLTEDQRSQINELKAMIDSAQAKIDAAKNSQPAVVYVPQPAAPAQPPQQQYTDTGRPDPLNTSLTYKRMSGINNTVLTDTVTYETIRAQILAFDDQCEDYMNGSGPVPSLLRPGTTAYNQQTNYKKNHPTLTQKYTNVNVINTREGGGYYYAWVTETLSMTENGATKTETDHWVYKLSASSAGWYIEDYTKDPAY